MAPETSEALLFQPLALSVDNHGAPVAGVDIFAELEGLLAEQPTEDKSEEFFTAIRSVFTDAEALEDINRLSNMAMTLGAMACLHPHLEDIANEMGEKYGGMGEAATETGASTSKEDSATNKGNHDASKCENCKAGKPCARKR